MARKWEKKILWKHVVRTISQVIDIIRIKYISRLNIAQAVRVETQLCSWGTVDALCFKRCFNVNSKCWRRHKPSQEAIRIRSRWGWKYVCNNIEVRETRGRTSKGYCKPHGAGSAESKRRKSPKFTLWWLLRTGDTREPSQKGSVMTKTQLLIHTEVRNELLSRVASA